MPKTSVDVILTTAARLFHERDFNEASVDQICQECGITKPTFYHYIPSKDDILATDCDCICDGIALRFSDVYQADSYLEQFDLLYGMVIDSSIELGPSIIGHMLARDLEQHGHSFDRRETLIKIAIPLIRKGQAAGEFCSPARPEDLYDAVNLTFLDLEVKWALRDGKIDWKGDFRRAAYAILGVTGRRAQSQKITIERTSHDTRGIRRGRRLLDRGGRDLCPHARG
jgi:AcrR family transcriptional regulator